MPSVREQRHSIKIKLTYNGSNIQKRKLYFNVGSPNNKLALFYYVEVGWDNVLTQGSLEPRVRDPSLIQHQA